MSRKASKLFQKIKRSLTAPTQSRTGYPAWDRPLEEQYLQTLLSNTLGNTFYASGQQLLDEAAELHDKMLAKDRQFAARALVFARERGFMRTQPIFGLAKLSKVDPALFGQVFDRVVLTPNDLADFAAILKSLRGGEGGRAIKRAGGKWMLANLDEYRVIKYGAERSEGAYSLKDLLQVYHPKAGTKAEPKRLPLFDYLMGREIDLSGLPQIAAFEKLKRADSDEAKVAAIVEGRLPHEVATTFAGSSKTVWNAIVPQLPIFALVRNLATLERQGVADENRELIEKKLGSASAIQKSKILPFRFLDAFNKVSSGWIKDALRDAVEHAFESIPELPGRTVVALDRSGSMKGFIGTAALFGVCLMKRAEGRMLLFDDRLEEVQVSKRDSILSQSERIKARGGTNHTLVLDQLLKDRDRVDNLIYITDEQQNAGGPLLDRIDEYRRKVNAKVKLFVVDVSPYRNAVVPATDENTWFIYGWSDQALSFISLSANGLDSQVEQVKKLEL